MSFRQKHPVITGLMILAGIFLLFWTGISLLISAVIPGRNQPELFGTKEGVGIVELKGMIVSSEETIESLTDFRKNSDIKAIVLRIDSPGGAVGASQEIYEEVGRTNAVKPVVASIGSVGASGGYYAALGAERIIANPGALTGSMGVIVKFTNLHELFEKIGYKSEVVKSGLMKDIGSIDRPLTPAERELVQKLIDNVHAQFVRAVAESRSMPEEEVGKLADGRIFSGEQALQAGLIDELGNLTDAVLQAAKLGHLDTEYPRLIYPEGKSYSLFDLLTGKAAKQMLSGLRQYFPVLAYEWTGLE